MFKALFQWTFDRMYDLVDCYVNIKVYVTEQCTELYRHSPTIQYFHRALTRTTHRVYGALFHIHIEPELVPWIHFVGHVAPTEGGPLQWYDHYRYLDTFVTNIHFIQYFTSQHHRTRYSIPMWEDNPHILVKYDENRYLSRMLYVYQFHHGSPSTLEQDLTQFSYLSDVRHLEMVPSKVRFISVTYSHPRMGHEVALEVPRGMFFVGNHLFSAVLVHRMLLYTVGEGGAVFDDKYVLKIMDDHINYLELGYKDFIELQANTYMKRQVE